MWRSAFNIGYALQYFVQPLKRSETANLLILVSASDDLCGDEVLRGIQKIAGVQGYLVLLLEYCHSPSRKKSVSKLINGRTIDSMLLLDADLSLCIDCS